MAASKVRGGIRQTEPDLVLTDGGSAQLTIRHQESNTAARTLTLPDDDADFLIIPTLHGGDTTKQLSVDTSGATASTTTTFASSQSANRTLTLPDATDTLVGRATTDTLTNKSIDSDNNTITNIVNADIKAAAAIAVNKLAALTVSRAIVSDGSGFVSVSATTSTELGYVSGVTSAVQTQLDAKIDDFTSTTDNALVRTDGTGGAAVQDSSILIDDSDNMSGVANLTLSGDIDVDAGAWALGATTGANNLTIGGSSSTVVIAGNLQIDGTTTTVNSTTMDVADVNITINDGGNQATADDSAGLTVEMSDATDATLLYDKDAASFWKIGESGSEVEVADISTAQTLTNKTATRIANSFTRTFTTYSSVQTLSATVDDIVLVSGTTTLNLPAVASSDGVEFTIKKTDSNATTVTLDGNSAEEIDGATTYTIIEQHTSVTIACNGSAWYIL